MSLDPVDFHARLTAWARRNIPQLGNAAPQMHLNQCVATLGRLTEAMAEEKPAVPSANRAADLALTLALLSAEFGTNLLLMMAKKLRLQEQEEREDPRSQLFDPAAERVVNALLLTEYDCDDGLDEIVEGWTREQRVELPGPGGRSHEAHPR